ncbi:MAG: hypothetical protein P4M14_12555, partial [Gammaproteobacteria bacterium]|nr:hypothetical protein [Gammaproteobacteria bacterium]
EPPRSIKINKARINYKPLPPPPRAGPVIPQRRMIPKIKNFVPPRRPTPIVRKQRGKGLSGIKSHHLSLSGLF